MRLAIAVLLAAQCWATTTLSIATPAIAKAGVSGSITLTATCAGPGTESYLWTNVTGPGTGVFGSSGAASTTFTAPVRGDYQVQIGCTNSDGTTTTSAHVGAVLVDVNDIVITGDTAIDRVLGPLTRLGASPWPYFDLADRAAGETIAAAALANPPHLGAQYTGTVQITTQPVTLIGAGTLFSTELHVNDRIVVAWNTVDGNGTGRYYDYVSAITDNTHAALGGYQTQFDVGSGLNFYAEPATTATFQPFWWGQAGGAGNTSWNYYDVALGLYRLYYRTGLTSIQTSARQMADYWWQYAIDHGRAGIPQRVGALQSQFVRALDGKSNRLPDLQTLVAYWAGPGQFATTFPHDANGTNFDAREAGYATWFTALGALADPDAGRHTSYCTWLATRVAPWNTWQHADGFFPEDLYSLSSGYVYKVPGASPWRTDIPIHGLQSAYEALIDTTSAGCNNVTLAATTLATITKAVAWAYNQGRSNPALGGNGGVYYDAGFETNGQVPLTVAGTVSVNVSSTSVTGVGTSFTSVFGSSGTKYIGFDSTRTIYKVTASADNTHLTITPAFGSQGELSNISGGVYEGANQASTSCASTAAFCWDNGYWPPFPSNGDRNLTRLMPAMTGWLYYYTGNTLYKTWGDNWFSSAFGGPGNGPGGTDPCIGAGCDGVETDFINALPYCGISANPPTMCNATVNTVGGNVYGYLGKNYGQGSGAPAAPTYLAYRLMGAAPATPGTGRPAPSGRASFATGVLR